GYPNLIATTLVSCLFKLVLLRRRPGSTAEKRREVQLVPSKILVPVDGSPASLRALDFAIKMTDQNPDTSLVLLNVQNVSAMDMAGAAMGSDWQEAVSQASAKALKEAVGKAEAAGIGFKSIVRNGQKGETNAQDAHDEAA